MKTYLTFLFTILLLLNSCGIPETATYNTIINNSNHDIKILVIFDYQIYDSIMIPIKCHKEYRHLQRGGASKIGVVFGGDSLIVVFDDSISITHSTQNPQDISRNLYYEENWPGGEVDEYKYRYEYIFTDADYQEALEKQ